MLTYHVLRSLLLGVMFTFISVSMAYFYASSLKQVYHTTGNLPKNRKLLMQILINLISSTAWIALAWGSRFFWVNLLLLLTMNLLANLDEFTGRIPIYFLLIAIVLGLTIGSLETQFFAHFIGGVSNMILGIIIFLAGQNYKKRILKQRYTHPVFGMGDVYACGSLGFLLGSPIGNLAILIAMMFALLGAGLYSLKTGADFLKQQVNIGISFYLATVVILIAKAL